MEREDDKLTSSPKALELKKHVAVIHSSNKLSLLQRKIANALLFNAYHNLQKQDEHVIHIAELCQLIGFDSKDFKMIKRELVKLLSTVLEWNLVDGDRLDTDGIWNASSIIADASIDRAICTYSYSNKMRDLLYRPSVYGKLNMTEQARFQSGYGLALYENCNRFQDIGKTPWFDLGKFRKLMGVDDKKYKIFRDFKSRVLDKAVEEVNKYSSLTVSAQLRKQNRQVISIQFLIKKAGVYAITHLDVPALEGESMAELLKMQFGLSAKQATDVVLQYEETYIKEKIDLIKLSPSFQQNKVKNLARYLLSALKEDYQPTRKKMTIKVAAEEALPSKKPLSDVQLMTEFRRAQDKQLVELFHQLPDAEKSSTLKKFEKSLVGLYQNIYLRRGLEDVVVQDQMCVFLRKVGHEIVRILMTYEAWGRISPTL